MPDFAQLVSVLGGPAAVAFVIWMSERKAKVAPKEDAAGVTPKEDAAGKLAAEIAALNVSINSLRSELAELGGFVKGRMK